MTIRGVPASTAATLVDFDTPIALAAPPRRFVSRGGEKLDRALERLDVRVEGRRWLDAGASTGGFTDRLLRGGAAAVVAADVGYGQLDWNLRNDPRVVVLERVNVRTLRPDDLPWAPDGVAADLSFISLSSVMAALVEVAAQDADHVLLVKPQFEAGRTEVGKGGVVRDPRAWAKAIETVVSKSFELGLGLVDAVVAEPPGPAGNREFFVHLARGAPRSLEPVERAISEAREPPDR